jgi:hypothetical protein
MHPVICAANVRTSGSGLCVIGSACTQSFDVNPSSWTALAGCWLQPAHDWALVHLYFNGHNYEIARILAERENT